MGGIGGVEDFLALLSDRLGEAVVDVGRGVEPDARVPVLVVVVLEEPSQKARAASMLAKRLGKVGEYLRVLNWDSE